MALYTGKQGYVKVGSDTIAHISNWEVELSKEMMEIVSFGNEYKEKNPGIKDWSASSEGTADFDGASNQKDLYDAYQNDTLLTFGFGLEENLYFSGQGYIESLTVTNDAEGKADISISVAGNEGVLLVDNIPTA